ncbi:MAG: PepSY-associated TM helix domain-containing protein [Methylomonas sp.]
MSISIRHLFARSVWLKIHLYLALSFGLLFALQGLTGSLSVYRQEIDGLFNPQQIIVPPQAQTLSLDKIIASVRQVHPDRHGVWTLELPRSPNQVITAWFEKPRETFGAFYAPLMVAVNPYTGEVIENRFWGQTVTTWLLDLHTHLRLEAVGRDLVAVLAVLLIMSVCSGLYLWWPSWASLRQAFQFRHKAGLSRFLIDLHRWVGLLSSVFLLLLAFTGFHLAYPPLIEALTASAGMGHGDGGPNVRSTAIPNDRPISLTEAVLVARGPFAQSELRRVSTPQGESGTYRINLRQKNEINQHHPITTVWVDRWSGQIRDVRNPNKFSAAQTFTVWLWPLHTGEAFGELGRLIWFFIGLTPMILYISGIYFWLQRKGVIKDRSLHFSENWQKSCQFSKQSACKWGNFVLRQSLKWIESIRRQ